MTPILSTVRRALADTIAAGVPEARVVPYPPNVVDIPSSGLHVYIAPDSDQFLEAWQTFTVSGRSTIRYQVVVSVPATIGPELAWDLLDRAADPLSTELSVFAAVLADRTLGISAFHVDAVPMLGAVASARLVADADGAVTRYELVIPIAVIVQRS